ncbi:MAG TPA: SMP-30/gluconolactonase/LRE family protein [Usitatibacter sp.]|nr:SMP-30/gluconolactonase/LRE family protein [Usitatibacter sp.]
MFRRVLVALAALAAVAGCAVAPRPAVDATPLVWPDPPDAARIAWVQAIARPEDFGIAKGFLERLGEILLGPRDARLIRPMAVAVAGQALFVADPGAGGVHRLDRAAARYDLVRLERDTPMRSPVGLAVGAQGEVYVTDSGAADVFVIRPGAKHAVRAGFAHMAQPTGIAFDAQRKLLYVVDTGADRVNVFEPDGRLRASFGQRGKGDGEFNRPTHVWCDSQGNVFVTDALNYRVQVFGPDGRFRRQFGQAGDASGDFMRHKGVATDSHGHVYVVDGLLGQLQIFDGQGRLLLALGSIGSDRGEFWLPAGVFVAADERIYVADSFNSRVQVFRYVGGTP